MGVRGLTTFIKSQEKKYLHSYKLHNCTVLVDGNSLASNLFIWSNIESAFGGDYDKFAKYVKEFFKVFQKCDITPLVVFDGGYEARKLRTVYSRLKEKFRVARQAQPLTGPLNFPLFMRIVFREVLTELDVPFAQSDFEADDELAALARQLQCPVLSYDSDFYIYNVLYIPLPSLSLVPIACNTDDSCGLQYYIDCKIYSVDVLLESFGGLDKSMLPLLAALLGNDYIKRSVFKAFYANLKIPKGKTNALQRRIKAVMEWLQKETFESAVRKILSRMKVNARKNVMRKLKKIVNGYIQCTSILGEYLAVPSIEVIPDSNKFSTVDCSIINTIEQIDENIDTIEDKIESDNDGDLSDEKVSSEAINESSEDECCFDESAPKLKEDFSKAQNCMSDEKGKAIPTWLLDSARKGKIQSCVIDILTLKQYFFPPQVEDYSLPSSHFISLKILSATVGLLLGKSDKLVKCWTRNGSHLDWQTVEPIYETASLNFPSCDKLLKISQPVRTAALLEIVGINVDLTVLPEKWTLFVVAIVFWLKNMEQPIASEAHLHTMVMCLVAISAIDSQIGVYRNKQAFTRKYKNFLAKVVEARSKEKALNLSKKLIQKPSGDEYDRGNPKNELANVTREDCVLAFETILPNHHLSEQVKVKPKQFCLTTVHAFAQFQSCLFHLIVLNSVLGFPLKEITVSHLYSGTFSYNVFVNLSKRNNISAYVETLFQSSPTLLNLYKALIHLLTNLLGDLHKKPLKSRKKKKRNPELKTEHDIYEDCEVDDVESFIDENNMFSGLSLNE